MGLRWRLFERCIQRPAKVVHCGKFQRGEDPNGQDQQRKTDEMIRVQLDVDRKEGGNGLLIFINVIIRTSLTRRNVFEGTRSVYVTVYQLSGNRTDS